MTAPVVPRGIAVLGGAFDPPHRTHRRIAEAALAQLEVGEVRVLPAGDHPWKGSGGTAPAAHRLQMCKLAFAGLPGVVVDDREVRRPGPSFTADTLAELAGEAVGRPLFLLIGSDNLPQLPRWRQPERILALATVVVFPRAGHPLDPALLAGSPLSPAERAALLAHPLALPADDVSSSDLRRRLAAGQRNLPELEPAVEAYLRQHRLYGT